MCGCAEGSGPTIVLCNGGPGCCDYMAPVGDMLTDCNFRVIRFKQRGCGRSDFTPPYTYDNVISDLEAIRNHYAVDKWIVGGHSGGVDIALAYTLAHLSRVRAAFGISGGRIVNDRQWHSTYKENRARDGEPLPDFPFPCDPDVNPQGNAWWREYITDPRLLRQIAEISVPFHFIIAANDTRPSWPTKQLANLIPQGSCEEIPDAKHYIWLTHATELAVCLNKFLNRIAAKDGTCNCITNIY